MWRTRPCRWFELLASRDDLTPVLEALAQRGAVELQTFERRGTPLVIEGAERGLDAFHALARTHRPHWPPTRSGSAARIVDPGHTLAARLAQLEAWRTEADPCIAALERIDAQDRTLADVAQLLEASAGTLPEPGLLASAGGFMVDVRVLALAGAVVASDWPADLLQLTVAAGAQTFVVLVGRRADLERLDAGLAARHARRVDWPHDLRGSVAEATHEVAARRAALLPQRETLARQLAALALQHDLAGALADIETVAWLLRHGSDLGATERLVWVTGWTTTADEAQFCSPLDQAGLRCVVQFGLPPPGVEPPALLTNPPWARHFEAFARLLGQPGADEADPSPLVAIVAPLLFGFMFGDVVQGALLCVAGLWLRRRIPMLVLLIPGGLAAMGFGVLFGSVFAREDLLPALWLHPLHEPITLLTVAIGFGALLLLAGLALNAAQAFWRGGLRQWWSGDAGLVLAYAGLLAALIEPFALWAVAAGALWMAIGSASSAEARRLPAFFAGLAGFVEQLLQLLVNTVSFARVGAFALAHAGLSVAIVGIAEAAGAVGYWIVLVLGNALVLLLEGLVVSIQTTRLLLFEFFVRFLRGTGRSFRPLPPPRLLPTNSPGTRP